MMKDKVFEKQSTLTDVSNQPSPVDFGDRSLLAKIGELFELQMDSNITADSKFELISRSVDRKIGSLNYDRTSISTRTDEHVRMRFRE